MERISAPQFHSRAISALQRGTDNTWEPFYPRIFFIELNVWLHSLLIKNNVPFVDKRFQLCLTINLKPKVKVIGDEIIFSSVLFVWRRPLAIPFYSSFAIHKIMKILQKLSWTQRKKPVYC